MVRKVRGATQRKAATVKPKSIPKLKPTYWDLHDITPYDKNPRFNEEAIELVAKSIELYGFLVPIVVGSDGVIAAGHTRYEASKLLGLTDVPVIIADHLTKDQLDAFRLADNKVAEKASWDYDMLSEEIARLSELGFDFTEQGWTAEEIDCMTDIVADDCLSAGVAATMDQKDKQERDTGPRAPARTRFVIGEFVIFIPTDDYKRWSAQIRAEGDYDQKVIETLLLDKLEVTPYLE